MDRGRVLLIVAVAATLAVAVAVVVWVVGQDAEPTGPAPVVTSSVTTPAAVITGTPGPDLVTGAPTVGSDVVDLGQFSSPTGNIGCVLSTASAVCEIGEHDFPLPPAPATCTGDWAATFELAGPVTPPTAGACQTDTQLGSPDLLDYGTTSVLGSFACLSQESGMTCWNQDTGHGFTVSRAAYALF